MTPVVDAATTTTTTEKEFERGLEMAEGRDYTGQSIDPSVASKQEVPPAMQLTESELRVLRECRTNSLYLRGLPMGLFSAVATRYLAHNFFPHVRNWAGFYYTGAFTLGMVAGVTSYREKCFEKIMSLDNSRLADEVRRFQQRAKGAANEGKVSEFQDDFAFSPKAPAARANAPYDPVQRGNFSSESRSYEAQDDDEPAPVINSYEELRKRQREKRYQGPRRLPNQQQKEDGPIDDEKYDPDTPYDKRETYSVGSPWESNLKQPSYDDRAPPHPSQQRQKDRPRKNIYGDEME